MKRHEKRSNYEADKTPKTILVVTKYGEDWAAAAESYNYPDRIPEAAAAMLRHSKGYRIVMTDGSISTGVWAHVAPLMEEVNKQRAVQLRKAKRFLGPTGQIIHAIGDTMNPEWFYTEDDDGLFTVYHSEQKYIDPEIGDKVKPGKVLSGVLERQAIDHLKMVAENESERNRFMTLATPHFNPKNWKLPTKRIVYGDEETANKVAEALGYFVGGAEVKPVDLSMFKGLVINSTEDRKGFEVGSLGYYHYVGA